MPFLCPWQFPLLPDAHAYSPIQPSVQFIDLVLHACDSIVIHPTSHIDLDLFQTQSYALTASTGRVFTQSVFELLHRLRVNAGVDSPAILPQREAEKLKISDREHADNPAFLLIYPEFQGSLKIFRACLQKSLRSSFALCQQDDIVCVADTRNSPLQILLIELVEVDIRQQWGKISSLCRASCYAELMKGTVGKQASQH